MTATELYSSATDRKENYQIAGEKALYHGAGANMRYQNYLVAADLFVLPSYSEGMPTVVIEALAFKVPVLCTAAGGSVFIRKA